MINDINSYCKKVHNIAYADNKKYTTTCDFKLKKSNLQQSQSMIQSHPWSRHGNAVTKKTLLSNNFQIKKGMAIHQGIYECYSFPILSKNVSYPSRGHVMVSVGFPSSRDFRFESSFHWFLALTPWRPAASVSGGFSLTSFP